MKIHEFFDRYELHDSGVESIVYNPTNQSLHLKFQLANYMQVGYKDDEPETTLGTVIFTTVKNFQSDPPFDFFNTLVKMGGDIVTYGHIAASDEAGLEAAEFVLNWFDYQNRTRTVLILSFLAAEAMWQPDGQ